MLFALIFTTGCNALESIGFTGATRQIPLIKNAEEDNELSAVVLSILKQPKAVMIKQIIKIFRM